VNVELFGSQVRFDAPWALALIGVALAALVLSGRPRGAPGGLLFSSLGLIPLSRTAWRVRLRWTLLPLRLGAVILLILALARPLVARAAVAEGIDIAIAIDISSSMGAKDFDGGTRIAAVKKVTRDFIGGLSNDRVALVAFQAEATQVSPLTLDYPAIQKLVDSLEDGGLRLRGGTAIGLGIASAVDLLRDSEAKSKVVIVLTDGENNSGEITPLDSAQVAKLMGVHVYSIGAVPTSQAGSTVVEVDERVMQRISEMTDAQYHRASDRNTLADIYRDVSRLEKARVGNRGYTDYEELYAPFLVVALALLTVELLLAGTAFRRIP
jgi:Ca-activated chloride channel family protein